MPEWWLSSGTVLETRWPVPYQRKIGGQADLIVLTPSNYLTEIEIKVTLADWNHDRHKEKWKGQRKHVSRFFYAVPESLADKAPEWIPIEAGILAVQSGLGKRIRTVRDAKRIKADPVSESEVRRMYEACYFRYWRERLIHLPRLTANIALEGRAE
jgi:hypothetical protein